MKRIKYLILIVFVALLVSCSVRRPNQRFIPYPFKKVELAINSPFQIIHAKNVLINDTLADLVRYDLIKQNDIITLKGGHLLMVHYLGEFFEFSGNTTIVVRDLIYQHYGIFDSELNVRPRISNLFETDRFYNVVTGAVLRPYAYALEYLIFPQEGNKYFVQKGKDICLFWENSELVIDTLSTTYQLVTKNIFDEIIDSTEVTDNKAQLLKLGKHPESYGMILLQSRSVDQLQYNSNEIALELTDEPGFYYPTSCDVSESAVKSLELAYYFENTGESTKAEVYYRNAASLSDEEIYDDILEAYLKRLN